MTKEIGGRSYRAPEVLFGDEQYTSGVDIWGVGCVLAELLLRRVSGLHLGGGLRAGRAAAAHGGWVVFSFCYAGMRTRAAVMDSMPSDKGPVLFPPPPPLMSLPL